MNFGEKDFISVLFILVIVVAYVALWASMLLYPPVRKTKVTKAKILQAFDGNFKNWNKAASDDGIPPFKEQEYEENDLASACADDDGWRPPESKL